MIPIDYEKLHMYTKEQSCKFLFKSGNSAVITKGTYKILTRHTEHILKYDMYIFSRINGLLFLKLHF